MFLRFILVVVSLMSFLRSLHTSGCDENCADKPEFTPSRLVVKHGDPTSASCSVCQHACIGNIYHLENPVGHLEKNGTTIKWTVNELTEWVLSPTCFYTTASYQCCSILPVTLYQPPDNVSISFDHTGPMVEGRQYTLRCSVQDVAPVENLTVTFYRGQTALGRLQSKNTQKKPVNEIFALNINASKEDDGVQYWCEAKLELGPEGPQHPPLVKSQSITVTVHYKPQLQGSSHLHPITVTEGNPLQLNCSAVGNPSPSYTWTTPSGSPSSHSDGVLTISSVKSTDGGTYNCSVSNDMGTVSVTFLVDFRRLKVTTTRLPPTTTTPTTPTTATTATTATITTTTTTITTLPSCSTSSILLHRFIMCFMLLFPALI